MPRHLENTDAGRELTWLMWLDLLERLDEILLEIRHHQINIIHTLRAPSLLRALKYEENYIWGSWQSPTKEGGCSKTPPCSWQFLLDQPFDTQELRRIAEAWTIPFPLFEHNDETTIEGVSLNNYDLASRKEAIDDISEYTRKACINATWGADLRRLYYSLSSLQILKRNVLYNKIILCRWGGKAFPSSNERLGRHNDISRFLLVRTAVLTEAKLHINHLNDLKSEFISTYDQSIQDHPKPMTSRRQEQGIYSAYLSEHYRDMRDLAEHFLNFCQEKREINESPPLHGTHYMHCNSLNGHTRAKVIPDILSQHAKREKSIDIINSSFWLLTRPDLQPLIMHELAHNLIEHAYDDLQAPELKNSKNHFIDLIRQCIQVIESSPIDTTSQRTREVAKELACDLIGATLGGHAYLYALTQEILGLDLEVLFDSPLASYDFDLADEWLTSGWAGDNHPQILWYLRLSLTSAWLECLHPNSNVLEKRLRSGVDWMQEQLLGLVTQLGPKGLASHHAILVELANGILGVAYRHPVRFIAENWIKSRNNLAGNTGAYQPTSARPRSCYFARRTSPFPPASAPMPEDLRNHLTKIIIRKKANRYSISNADVKKIETWFSESYLNETTKHTELFKFVHDIPWQCSLLRARDLLQKDTIKSNFFKNKPSADNKPSDPELPCRTNGKGMLLEMNHDGSPGHEIYDLALEFSFWAERRSIDTVTQIQSWLHQVFDNKEWPQWLLEWRRHTPIDTNDTQAELTAWLKELRGCLIPENSLRARLRPRPAAPIWVLIEAIWNMDWASMKFSDRVLAKNRLNDIILSKIDRLARTAATSPDIDKNTRSFILTCAGLHEKDGEISPLLPFLLKGFVGKNFAPDLLMLDRVVISSGIGPYIQADGSPLIQNVTLPDGQEIRRHYHPVLGRYDFFGLSVEGPGVRCYMPMIVNKNPKKSAPKEESCGIKGLLPPFFQRHELTLRYQSPNAAVTNGGSQEKIDEIINSKDILAFLGISLATRASRLGFLHRLGNGDFFPPKNHLTLLSEGWGDIIIAFRKNGDALAALNDIFKFQDRIFSDFQVERTEMILTFNALPIANQNYDKYQIISRIRVDKQTRGGKEANGGKYPQWIKEPNSTFIKQFKKSLPVKTMVKGIRLVRTPGRTDYTIRYEKTAQKALFKNLKTISVFFQSAFSGCDEVLTVLSQAEERLT